MIESLDILRDPILFNRNDLVQPNGRYQCSLLLYRFASLFNPTRVVKETIKFYFICWLYKEIDLL